MDPQPSVVAAVRRFVEQDVRPAAPALDHADAYPHALVARMRALGLFGALVPRDYGGAGLDVTTFARGVGEVGRGGICRGGGVHRLTVGELIWLGDRSEAVWG